MPFRPFLAVAPAIALMFAPVALAAQDTRPPVEAPYATKLKCAVINAFMSGFVGEETPEGAEAEARGEEWIDLAMAEKPTDEMAVASDFEAEAVTLQTALMAMLDAGNEDGVLQMIDDYAALCAPFGG